MQGSEGALGTEAPAEEVPLRETDVKTWRLPAVPGIVDPKTREPFTPYVVQDKMTYFEKAEFLGLAARAVDLALSRGVDIGSIIKAAGADEDQLRDLQKNIRDRNFSAAGSSGLATNIAMIIAKIFQTVPELLLDAYLIFLSVPPELRDRFRRHLELIDDETGFEMLEIFTRQNSGALRDFVMRWAELVGNMISQATTTSQDEG